jgi:hypothetical protein
VFLIYSGLNAVVRMGMGWEMTTSSNIRGN